MVAKVGRNKPNSDLPSFGSTTRKSLRALDTAIDLAKVRHNVAIVLPLVCQVEAGIGQCVGRIDMNPVGDQSCNALCVSRSPVMELIGAVINNGQDFGSEDKVHRMRSGLLRCFKMAERSHGLVIDSPQNTKVLMSGGMLGIRLDRSLIVLQRGNLVSCVLLQIAGSVEQVRRRRC